MWAILLTIIAIPLHFKTNSFRIWNKSFIWGRASFSSAVILQRNSLYEEDFIGSSPEWYSQTMIDHANLLIQSYFSLTKKDLYSNAYNQSLQDPTAAAIQLFQHPSIYVLSHGTQKTLPDGPILNYGNMNVLNRWKVSWEELTTMPSSHTVEAGEQRAQRSTVMNEILAEKNYLSEYEGIRINKEQQRFKIVNTTIWNVYRETGIGIGKGKEVRYFGQAAVFERTENILL